MDESGNRQVLIVSVERAISETSFQTAREGVRQAIGSDFAGLGDGGALCHLIFKEVSGKKPIHYCHKPF